MKTRLDTRIGQKTLEGKSKWHLNTKVRSASKSQFSTFGVLNQIATSWALAQRPSGDDKAHPFRPFCKRMSSDSHPNHPCLFFRDLWPYK